MTFIEDDYERKLLLGTKSFESLSFCSVRLDLHEEPNVGPTTKGFGDHLDSAMVKIFINEESWKAAEKLYFRHSNQSIHSYDNLYQLRQLQTKFDKLST